MAGKKRKSRGSSVFGELLGLVGLKGSAPPAPPARNPRKGTAPAKPANGRAQTRKPVRARTTSNQAPRKSGQTRQESKEPTTRRAPNANDNAAHRSSQPSRRPEPGRDDERDSVKRSDPDRAQTVTAPQQSNTNADPVVPGAEPQAPPVDMPNDRLRAASLDEIERENETKLPPRPLRRHIPSARMQDMASGDAKKSDSGHGIMDVVARERQLNSELVQDAAPVNGFPVIDEVDEDFIPGPALADEDPDDGEDFIRRVDRNTSIHSDPSSQANLVSGDESAPPASDDAEKTAVTGSATEEAVINGTDPEASTQHQADQDVTTPHAEERAGTGSADVSPPQVEPVSGADSSGEQTVDEMEMTTTETLAPQAHPEIAPEAVEQSQGMELRSLFDTDPAFLSRDDLHTIMMWGTDHGVSDIYLQTGRPAIVSLGHRYVKLMRRTLTTEELNDLLKDERPGGPAEVMGGIPQDFAISFRKGRDRFYRYRINVSSCRSPIMGQRGLEWVIRPIPTIVPHVDDLNVEPAILKAAFPNDGLVLVTGPTGSGKSTLLAAFMRRQIEHGKRVLTYEEPVEYQLSSIVDAAGFATQSEVGLDFAGEHGTFSACVPNAMRRRSDIILLGEARDNKTVSGTITAADTGHAVYTTVHTFSAVETIRRMAGTFEPQYRPGIVSNLADSLRLIVHQRLVRSVKDPDKRVALREYLVFDQALREKLLFDDFSNFDKNLGEAMQATGQTLAQDAQRKYDEGLIDRLTLRLIQNGEIHG